jgi:protein-L-isoaspartate O-methyltransferase
LLDRALRGSAFGADAQPDIRAGDGTRGWPEQAPFDRILISAAADDTAAMLLE